MLKSAITTTKRTLPGYVTMCRGSPRLFREQWLSIWVKQPKDFAQIDKVVDLYESLGVDRIAAWTYRGGYGTVLAAPDALKLWDAIGENYKRVLKK